MTGGSGQSQRHGSGSDNSNQYSGPNWQQSQRGRLQRPPPGGYDGPDEHSRNPSQSSRNPSNLQNPNQQPPMSPGQNPRNPGHSRNPSNLQNPNQPPPMSPGQNPRNPGHSRNPSQQTPMSPRPGQAGVNSQQQAGIRSSPQTPQQLPAQPVRQNPYTPGLGYDPAKPAPAKEKVITNTRVELPASAYRLEGPEYNFPSDMPLRPGFNTTGKAVQVRINQFKVAKWPSNDIYQYDILIGNGDEKRGKVKAVWNSKAVQTKLRSLINGPWIWDGNKIAWCQFNVAEQRIMVDLDVEKGRQPRGQPDQVYCIVRKSSIIRMAVIQGYLSRQMAFDSSILEAINFLDHLLRQYPSETYTMIKRSFYSRGKTSVSLDNVIVAMKGVYSSMRLCNPQSSVGPPGTGLAINVDVANGTFWAAQDLHQAARNLCKERNRNLSYTIFRDLLKPIKNNKDMWTMSEDFKELGKMVKLRFRVKHRGKSDDDKIYTIKQFTFPKTPAGKNFPPGGANAKTYTFMWNNRAAGTQEEISIYDYFRRVYNFRIEHWGLPLVVTNRDGVFPMEVCELMPNQRYSFKMSPEQTAAMIKFAVTRPKERIQSIQHGISMLKWNTDRYLNHFGLSVDPNMTVTQARLLQNPEVQFKGSKINPGVSGRWDLRGRKFFQENPEPLVSWGIAAIESCADEAVVRNFVKVFVQTYIGHGGRVANTHPVIYIAPEKEEPPYIVQNLRQQTGMKFQMEPQILFYIFPARNSWLYERIKRNNECRFATLSQGLNIAHVRKAQAQYCSNVCMKVNAKLGGITAKVVNTGKAFKRKTMIIGSDVSHPTPGSPQASMAAITMSLDDDACRYAAGVQTNGYRVEMITRNNIKNVFLPMFKSWVTKMQDVLPEHIYYFRDGVSEGQYSHVLSQEVSEMKKVINEEYGNRAKNLKWTVTVCGKRHHIRFFPKDNDSQAGDKNGNPLPGTLVERDVTHPFEYDFYLNSHSAIQGTARPAHYHVLMDEAKVDVNDFQKLIYQSSYQYIRSTTPVSIFPAIYYAHLASNRARAHENRPSSDGPRGGQKFEEARQDAAVAAAHRGILQVDTPGTQHGSPSEAAPLLLLGSPDLVKQEFVTRIRRSMWYI